MFKSVALPVEQYEIRCDAFNVNNNDPFDASNAII
jgi:hypothetical protein